MTKEELIKKNISAISLGCDKNKVDLEKMLGRLKEYGFSITEEIERADIVIVNTCAFIQVAQEEAIASIAEMEEYKKKGVIEKLIVTGCFPERNYEQLKDNFPNVDLFLKLRDNDKICEKLESLYELAPSKPNKTFQRVLTSGSTYAYLKIADGCNNVCSYCTIPRIRGRYVSYPIGDLVDEAKNLADRGIKEIILVAQDTTRYGEDLYEENCLIKLCDKLSKINGIKWIRILYAYPEKVSDELLSYIAQNDKMCKYLDIPLQHIDDKMLNLMRRHLNEEKTRELINKINTFYPQIRLRSTFIVGHPGEDSKKFKKLCNFIDSGYIDYAGFFPYSREPNTASYYMKNQVSNFVKKKRLNKILKLQRKIMTQKAQDLINCEMEVLVDYFDENTGEYCSHSQNLCPMIDFGVRFVDNGNIKIGDFVKVKIYDFNGEDYKGEIV